MASFRFAFVFSYHQKDFFAVIYFPIWKLIYTSCLNEQIVGVNDLQVKTCGFPPLEDREKSLAMFPGIDFFGGGSLTKEETVSFEHHC